MEQLEEEHVEEKRVPPVENKEEEASPSDPKKARVEPIVARTKTKGLKKKNTPSSQVSKTILKAKDEEQGEKIEFFP